MSFSQFLTIIKARWIVISGVMLVAIITTLAASLLLPKQYTASASVLVDVKSPDPINGMVLQAMMTPAYMTTQVEVVRSERVARRVIEGLRLDGSSAMRAQWQEQTEGLGNFQSWLAELLLKNLEVTPSKDANVITVEYTAQDPQFASALANAFVQSYVDTTLELRVQPAKQFSNLFDSQARELREKLEAAQSKLSKYQQEKGIVATEDRIDVENQRLLELSSQLVALQSLSAETSSRNAFAGSNSPEVLGNPVVATLKADVSRVEARLKELSAKFGPAHPSVQEAQANIDELHSRLQAEIGRVNASVGVSSRVNKSRESQIKLALEQQRQRILKMREQRDEASVLLRDVENATRAYEAINHRLNLTNLESQSNQTNVAVLKSAAPPASASKPRVILNTILAVLLGGLLAVSTAILLELGDRRLRSVDDVVYGLRLAVLGTMPSISQRSIKAQAGQRPGLLAGIKRPSLNGPRAA